MSVEFGCADCGVRVPSDFFVDRMPCLSSLRCPLDVTSDLGKYLRTRAEVSAGHVAKYPLSIAAHHVDTAGLKAAAWRKVIRLRLDRIVYALFAIFVLFCFTCAGCVVLGDSGMSQRPVRLFRVPIFVVFGYPTVFFFER